MAEFAAAFGTAFGWTFGIIFGIGLRHHRHHRDLGNPGRDLFVRLR